MRYRAWFLGASGIATLVVVLLVVVPSALSVGGPDEYTASISPTTVVAGTGTIYTLTITDSGSTGKMGAANITIPSGYTGATFGTPTTSSGKTWTASISSGVVQLRAATNGQVISPGDTVSVVVTTANALTVTGSYTWATAANEAIDFSGIAFTRTGNDPAVTVTPGPLHHFNFANISARIAGTPFGVTVTARDSFGNLKYDYPDGSTGALSGLGNSPLPLPIGTPPVYNNPLTFTAGVASGNVTAYLASNTSQLIVNSGGKSGSTTFIVQPADPALLTFTQQPNDAQPNPPTCVSPFVCVIATAVKDLDQYGNPEAGVNVTLVVDPANNPGSDSLSGSECTGGSCVQQADASGIATFSDLTTHVIATKYKLKATSGPTVGISAPATVTSNYFNVANQVKDCSGPCNANAQDQFDTINATATGVNGNLSITLESTAPSNSQTCSEITQQVGNFFTVNPTDPGSSPTLEVTGTLFHKNNKTGVGNSFVCKNSGPDTAFVVVPSCSHTKPKNDPPCLVKLSGNGAGDIFFDMLVKYLGNGNFDPTGIGGH
jgi:hypothetical protein